MSRYTVLLLLCSSTFFGLSRTVAAATYYLDDAGCADSNDGSYEQPWCTFAHGLARIGPGDTLVAKDGVYHEQLLINKSGTPERPLTIKAEKVGQAVIEMTTAGPAILVSSSLTNIVSGVVVDGFFAKGWGEHGAVEVRSPDNAEIEQMANHIIMRRIGAFGSAVCNNVVVFGIARTRDSLFEDIYAFGNGRKALQVYGAVNITIRRAVVRFDHWEGSCYKPNDPRVAFSGYNTHDSTFENLIAIDSGPGGGDRAGFVASGNDAPGQILGGSKNNRYLESIAVNIVGNGVEVNGGSGRAMEGLVFRNMAIIDSSGFGFNLQGNVTAPALTFLTLYDNGLAGFRSNPYPSSGPIEGVTLTQSVSVGNRLSYTLAASQVMLFEDNSATFNAESGSYPTTIESEYMPDLTELLNPGYVEGHERGARIVNRTVDGIVTEAPLWPWPYEKLIKSRMCDPDLLAAARRTGDDLPGWCATPKSLTQYVWESLGDPCPQTICPPPDASIPSSPLRLRVF